jgi:hypothetical protein
MKICLYRTVKACQRVQNKDDLWHLSPPGDAAMFSLRTDGHVQVIKLASQWSKTNIDFFFHYSPKSKHM